MSTSTVGWDLEKLPEELRRRAEQAAQSAGLPLARWLDRAIRDAGAAEGITPPRAEPAPPPATPAAPVTKAPPRLHPLPRCDGPVAALPLAAIEPGSTGTRRPADDGIVAVLAASIAAEGVRKALLVRRLTDTAERYVIVAGERRRRAALQAGLAQVPAVVVALSDAQAILASLAENLQHADFSPLDEARAYLRLMTEFGQPATAITAAIDRSREHITRSLRLLGLPESTRQLLDGGGLSAEHAHMLLEAPDPEGLARAILARGLSVAEARAHLAGLLARGAPS